MLTVNHKYLNPQPRPMAEDYESLKVVLRELYTDSNDSMFTVVDDTLILDTGDFPIHFQAVETLGQDEITRREYAVTVLGCPSTVRYWNYNDVEDVAKELAEENAVLSPTTNTRLRFLASVLDFFQREYNTSRALISVRNPTKQFAFYYTALNNYRLYRVSDDGEIALFASA